MPARKPVFSWMLLLAASAVGCAQWQQGSDDLAASALDQRLFARIASALGEQPLAAAAPVGPMPPPQTPQALNVPSQRQPVRRDASQQPRSPVRQATAFEALDAAAPTPDAVPIETAPAASQTLDHHAADCGDVCCQAGRACPVDRPCPILGACRGCSACLAGHRCTKLFTRPEPGPPPIRYRPAMPPKFLPVPTQPVLSPARPDAPDPRRGNIEFGWGPELMFPGDD